MLPLGNRILVTGSRTWPDSLRLLVAHALDYAAYEYVGATHPGAVTLVSGACPTGADRIAEECAKERGWRIERHPADWDRYGSRAGVRRNLEMVERGAAVCVAFLMPCANPRCVRTDPHESHGTTHCVASTRSAGIPVMEWRPSDALPLLIAQGLL